MNKKKNPSVGAFAEINLQSQLYSNFCWIMKLKENIYLENLNNQQGNQQK